MWIGQMRLGVRTGNHQDAGTDQTVATRVIRDGQSLVSLKLDYPNEDDLEVGAFRLYGYYFSKQYFDKTKPLPDGIGQWPPPYPGHGIELSSGIEGHLVLQLRPSGDDAWQKDVVHVHMREIRKVADGFDSWNWVEDNNWTYIGSFPRDVWISADSDEGSVSWNLRF